MENNDYLKKDYRNFYNYDEELIIPSSNKGYGWGCALFLVLIWSIFIYLIVN
jgi:hypothetical protein